MELNCNNLIQNRNGSIGAVACILGTPYLVVFASFTMKVSQFDENGKNKNSKYDIVKVFDGSNVENPSDIFKKSFNVDNLNVVWEENK